MKKKKILTSIIDFFASNTNRIRVCIVAYESCCLEGYIFWFWTDCVREVDCKSLSTLDSSFLCVITSKIITNFTLSCLKLS